jgi:hypothetical protein
LCFKYTYIDALPRTQNAFAEYGNLNHELIEEYFSGKLLSFELADEYEKRYNKSIISSFPPYPAGMAENYYKEGLEFFENFDFDISKYNILLMEDSIEYKHKNINLIVKPDAVLQDKETGKITLLDFKTSKLSGNKTYDNKKIKEYTNQMYLYAYFIFQAKNIAIDNIKIWFLRNNIFQDIPIDQYKMQETIEWFENTVYNIGEETEWKANNSKGNKYFCENLCSCRNFCEFKE